MLKIVELFAGIGAQAQALENLGVNFESIVCEIDSHAYRAYCAIHGYAPNLGDITKVEHLPECDLLTYSFPCQDLSTAGNMKGMSKDSGTRSSLLWEVGRLLEDAVERGCPPKTLLMENVPMVHSSKNRTDWNRWLTFLNGLGYANSWADLNACDFDVPQHRERCFMVSTRNGYAFQFPPGKRTKKCLRDILEDDVPKSCYLSKATVKKFNEHKNRHESLGHGFGWEPTHGGDISKCVTTIPLRQAGNFLICEGSQTRIRILTPRECWRLMGFSDGAFDKASAVASEPQLYKQAGNSIVVPVLEAIFSRLLFHEKTQPTLTRWV